MPFKPTIVAMPEDPSESPYLGFPLTEIVLEESAAVGAAIPVPPSFDSRDKITESVTGDDVVVARTKVEDIAFDIDYVTTEKKMQLVRLVHDSREVFVCPNVGPNTEWSFPLFRSINDFMGRKTMAITRAESNFFWDDTDKVMRSWDANEACFPLNGHWQRFLRTTYASSNEAERPHPNTTSTGWTTVSGSPTIAYTTDVKTRCLEYRKVTNNTGVTLVTVPSGGAASIQHTTSVPGGLDTTNDVVASVVARWYGTCVFALIGGSGTGYDSKAVVGDGTWQIIRLGGANADSSTSAKIQISFASAVSKRQMMLIDTVYIGNDNQATGDPKLLDWHDGTSVQDAIVSSDSNDLLATEITLSFVMKFVEDQRIGILYCSASPQFSAHITSGGVLTWWTGGGSASTFSDIGAEFSLSDGEWIHVVLRGSNSGGVSLFVNTIAHSDNGTDAWEPQNFGSTLKIGQVLTTASLDRSGICLLRCDTVAWTTQQIKDHYDTYFEDKGRGVIEPTFGKPMYIESLHLDPVPAAVPIQWRGQIVLRGKGGGEDYASVQRQEGDI